MLKIAKISTGLTVFAASGFLVGAILTDNGSDATGHLNDDAKVVSLKVESASSGSENTANAAIVDKINTSSIRKIENIRVEPIGGNEPTLTPKDRLKALSKLNTTTPRKLNIEPEKTENVIVVEPGDTLYGIGRRAGLSVKQIAELNGLSDPYRIRPGQKLIVSQ